MSANDQPGRSLSRLASWCLGFLLLAAGPARPGEQDRVTPPSDLPASAVGASPVYAQDVEFLLTELERGAGRFFPLKGVNWARVSAQFREEVKSVKSDVEHVKLCLRLVARLRDGHAGLTDLKVEMPDESRARRWTGPCVHLLTQDGRVYVRQAFGPAADKGVAVGIEVTRIDGLPARTWLDKRVETMRDDQGYSTDHQALYAACHWGMAEWGGTPIDFELLVDGERKTVTLLRQGGANFVPIGPVYPPPGLRRIGRQSYGRTESGFGYIHLRDTPGNLPEQLDVMLEAIGEVPGFILDMRANGGGGCDHTAVFGRFVPPGATWRQYPSSGRKPFGGPLVVIVDPGTRSAGETVSGMFKEDGRAYMIGEGPTAGTSSQKDLLPVPSGLFSVRFSVASNKQRFNQMRGIEGIGVPPHELVPYDPAQLRAGVDTLVRHAEELLRKGLPAERVPYETMRPKLEADAESRTSQSASPSTPVDLKPVAPIPTAEELPGSLVFHGRYQHRSRGGEMAQPSELWLKQAADGSLMALADLPFSASKELVIGDIQNRPIRHRIGADPGTGRPGYHIGLELGPGKALLSRRGVREDADDKEIQLPESAWFDPNTRPDSYLTANLLLRAFAVKPGESKEFRVYDWDNTGEAMAEYAVRIEFVGQESITVPAGTFRANHLKLTQLTSANTWFKKRAGHVTDFWLLDNHVIVRVLRHREPYEMLLLDYTHPHTLPGSAP